MRGVVQRMASVLVAIAMLVPIAAGQDAVTVRASVSAGAVYVGDSLIFSIEVENAEPDATPVIPGGERAGFEAEYLSRQNKSFSSTVIVNGEITQTSVVSYVLYYRITPLRAGEFAVPSIEVRAGGEVLRTEPVPFRVVGASERQDLRATLSASSTEPYVGQPFEVRLELLVERGASINNAVFTLPGVDERFSVQETPSRGRQTRGGFDFLGAPAQITMDRVTVDGVEFDRVRTSRTLVASVPGEATIGPGVWICDFVPARTRRGARVAVPTDELTVRVQELPLEGRPSEFTGLIGEYRLSASAMPTEVRVGDPIRFELTLEGPGDLRRIEAPEIAGMPGFDSGFRLANRDAERQLGDGRVTFRYVIRAITDAVEAIPSVVLNSFDPVSGEYDLIETDPIPLKVAPSKVVTAVDGEAFTRPAAEAQRVESAPRTLAANRSGSALLQSQRFTLGEAVRSPVVIGLVAAPPAAYLGLLAAVALRRRNEQRDRALAIRPAAQRAAAELKRSGASHAEAVRGALVRYEALRSACSEDVLTPGDAALRIAKERPDLAERASRLAEACESARFSGRAEACNAEHRREVAALLQDLAKGGAR